MKNTLLFLLVMISMAAAQARMPDSTVIGADAILRELPDQRTYNSKTFFNSKDETFTTVVSAGFIHYQAPDGSYRDIDTRFQQEDSAKTFEMRAGLYRVRVDHHASTGRDYDVTLDLLRPVREKFRDPGKPRVPTQLRYKLLSMGYLDLQQFLYRPLEFPNPVEQNADGNRLEYPEIFYGIDLRYTCNATGFKEEFILSEKGRERLPDPAQISFVPERTYLMFAFEFKLTPDNLRAFAKTPSGRVPVKERGRFGFNGESPIAVEDEFANPHLFFSKDYAWAEADSANDFVARATIRRYIYTDRGKDYMLVGVPWSWVNQASKGNLIIDPTVVVAQPADVYLQDTFNHGASTSLIIGKTAGVSKKRTLLQFNLAGIPTNATVLNARLQMNAYAGNGTTWVDRWVQVHQMLVEWDEGIATKDLRLFEEIGIPWSTPYAGINGTDANAQYESTLLFQETTAMGWKTWDLSALTQKWINGSATNYGVILWTTSEGTDGKDLRFRSSEYTVFQNLWPKLEITYSTETKTVYFLKDHLGSVRATVLDSIGAPVIGYDDYDPWGYPLAGRTKAIPTVYLQGGSKIRFTGKERDEEYGLNWDYFGGRYYDWLRGQWISRDPLAEKYPSWSPYNYALGNPVVLKDIDGRFVITVQVEARLLAGGTFSGSLGIAVDHHRNVSAFVSGTGGLGGGFGGSAGVNASLFPAAASINDISGLGAGIGAFAGFGQAFVGAEGNISFQSDDFRLAGTLGVPGLGVGIGIGAFAEGSYTHFLKTTTLDELLKDGSEFLTNEFVQQLQAELGISKENLVKLIGELQLQAQKAHEEQSKDSNTNANSKRKDLPWFLGGDLDWETAYKAQYGQPKIAVPDNTRVRP